MKIDTKDGIQEKNFVSPSLDLENPFSTKISVMAAFQCEDVGVVSVTRDGALGMMCFVLLNYCEKPSQNLTVHICKNGVLQKEYPVTKQFGKDTFVLNTCNGNSKKITITHRENNFISFTSWNLEEFGLICGEKEFSSCEKGYSITEIPIKSLNDKHVQTLSIVLDVLDPRTCLMFYVRLLNIIGNNSIINNAIELAFNDLKSRHTPYFFSAKEQKVFLKLELLTVKKLAVFEVYIPSISNNIESIIRDSPNQKFKSDVMQMLGVDSTEKISKVVSEMLTQFYTNK